MRFIIYVLSVPFPMKRVSRERFFYAWIAYLLSIVVAVSLPSIPSFFGMEFIPQVAESINAIGGFMIVVTMIAMYWHFWWRIADTKPNAGNTWFWFIIGSFVPFVSIVWFFSPSYSGPSDWSIHNDALTA